MEHGIVTSVMYEDGVVYCNVKGVRISSEYKNVPVLKPHSGFVQMPKQGMKVAMDKLSDGTRFIQQVIGKEDSTPDDMKEGEMAIQLDNETVISFTKKPNGGHDLTIGASGDILLTSPNAVTLEAGGDLTVNSDKAARLNATGGVYINGTEFGTHTHDHDDSTIEDTGDGTGTESTATKTTGGPN